MFHEVHFRIMVRALSGELPSFGDRANQMKSNKSLVFFTSLPAVGGHTTSTLGLVKLLRDQFRDIFIIAKEMPGHGVSPEAKSSLQEHGAKIVEIPAGKSLVSGLSALLSCAFGGRLHRPTCYLAMGMRNLAPVLAFALRPQCSVYFHITHQLTPATSKMLNNYGRLFSRIVFISPATYRDFKARKGLQSAWGLAPSELVGPISDRAKRVPGPIRLGYIGRLNEAKGSKVLLDFATTAAASCEMHVAGGGEFEPAFTAIQTQANRTSPVTVKYWGKFSVADRQKFFSSFFPTIDYLIVPTQDEMEGIPGVILESLQFGVPVVATRTGGVKAFEMKELGPAEVDVVRLVPKEDVSRELVELVSQSPPLEAISPKCRAYYARYFSDAVLHEHWSTLLGVTKKGLSDKH
jgi:glycosyltransferase involved in cell wall biosynthesis